MKVVAVSGYFDPIHVGHLEYLNMSKKLGDKLVVIVNNNHQCVLKKGKPFMDEKDRLEIVKSLKMVDEVFLSIDKDKSVCASLEAIKPNIFANGGDRTKSNIPEMQYTNVEFVFGVGGENKANSSSWILNEWKAPKTKRTWGYYRVIHEYENHTKVKELAVPPGGTLSMQRHQERSEHWFVAEGTATVYTLDSSTDVELHGVFEQHKSLHIPVGQWHQLANEHDVDLKLVEIQYGTNCVEKDIERQ